jgi:hypothetical protein
VPRPEEIVEVETLLVSGASGYDSQVERAPKRIGSLS